ncbi:MAG: hypothetical protein SVY15_09975 [Halobacteriota archaeon]|nr:hypothetical protein [Halobacteriota archaeon]
MTMGEEPPIIKVIGVVVDSKSYNSFEAHKPYTYSYIRGIRGMAINHTDVIDYKIKNYEGMSLN